MIRPTDAHDPRLDLVLERVIDVPPELVWQAWTVPEHVKGWWTPRPWTTIGWEIDLRPGGTFRTVMRSPDGKEEPLVNCYLEVVEGKRLVWTNVLLPGFRPNPEPTVCGVPTFTAVITIEPHGEGTRYVARAMHRDPEGRTRHEGMGFNDGWGTALDQLVELMSRAPAAR